MKDTLNLIKIGGNIIDDEGKLQSFLGDFARLSGPKILVHGGGKIATEVAKGLGIEAKMVEGRRITDAHMLRVKIPQGVDQLCVGFGTSQMVPAIFRPVGGLKDLGPQGRVRQVAQ